MAQTELNRIRNPMFATGRDRPHSWTWESLAGSASWNFDGVGRNGDGRVIVLQTPNAKSAGQWSQSFRCRSRHDYRIEILAACRVAANRSGGLSVQIRSFDVDGKVLDCESVGGPWNSARPVWWRARYRTPPHATRLEVSLRLAGATATAELHRIRAFPMDYTSCEPHPVSVPPWPHAYPRPRRVRTIEIADQPERGRRLAAILRARFGRAPVRVRATEKWGASPPSADAVFVGPDVDVSGSLTWSKLNIWAKDRMIFLSLPAFEQLINRHRPGIVRLREHVQDDDTLGVKIDHADFLTNGFALHDVFEWSVWDPGTGWFRQRQIIRTPSLSQFMNAESIHCVLSSDTNTDASSGRPTCLFKETPGGGLLVMDTDSILAPQNNEAEANPGFQILANALGLDTVSIGQFADSQANEPTRSEQLLSLARQVPGMTLSRMTVSGKNRRGSDAATQPIVSVAPAARQFGRMAPPPLLIRTGLDQRARDGYDGTLTWIKSLGRMEPSVPRYAPLLCRCRSVVWVPYASRVTADQLRQQNVLQSGALILDVCTTTRNVLRVVTPARNSTYRCYFDFLQDLDRQLRLGRMFGWLPAGGAPMGDHDAHAWRSDDAPLEVVAESAAFDNLDLNASESVRRIRVEVPQAAGAGVARSILQTEQCALLLEWIAGLEIGLVAVNRDPAARKLKFAARPLSRLGGSATVISAQGLATPLSTKERERLGRTGLRIPAGGTLMIQRGES